jgi:8-oxo-dGTP diphosphatase
MPQLRITTDVVLFTIRDRQLQVRLTKRKTEAPQNRYTLPGTFVTDQESLDAAAARGLREETGLKRVYLEQLYTFGDPKRDPRGRVVSVSYCGLVAQKQLVEPAADASNASWFPFDKLPPLAFDHGDIVEFAYQRIRNKLSYTNVGFELLPPKFTLSELQDVHEAILGEPIDKRNFRRKLFQSGIVKPTGEWIQTGRRPPQLFRFTEGTGHR